MQEAGIPSASEGDSKSDLVNPKTIAMPKLKRKQEIVKGKRKVGTVELWEWKFQSVSVMDSEEEEENMSVGLLRPKQLKTEPGPQAKDRVFSEMVCRVIGL